MLSLVLNEEKTDDGVEFCWPFVEAEGRVPVLEFRVWGVVSWMAIGLGNIDRDLKGLMRPAMSTC
jgi:hypothetical protein